MLVDLFANITKLLAKCVSVADYKASLQGN